MRPAYKVWQRFARANLAFRVSLSKCLMTVNNSGRIASADMCSSAILRPIFQGLFRDQRCRADYSDRIMIKLDSMLLATFYCICRVVCAQRAYRYIMFEGKVHCPEVSKNINSGKSYVDNISLTKIFCEILFPLMKPQSKNIRTNREVCSIQSLATISCFNFVPFFFSLHKL